jgi:hypothetical protein
MLEGSIPGGKFLWHTIETAPLCEFVMLAGGTWGDDTNDESQCIKIARWADSHWEVCSLDCGHSISVYHNPTHWASLERLFPTTAMDE